MRKSFETAENRFREHNGILRTSQAIRLGIDEKTLSEMASVGLLVKETKGIFRLASNPPLSNPDLIQVSLRIPHCVICLVSALSFHNLTTQIPNQVYIAIANDKNKPQLEYPPIDVIRLTSRVLLAGIEIYHIDGIPVRIYDKEKTIADCFKFRNKIGQDVALEALRNYLKEPNPDIEKLLHYAQIDRVYKTLFPYLEIQS
jgi:predicted transcriptional regulator of viral defense system